MMVCTSIAPGSMAEALQQLHRHVTQDDLIELRIDAIRDLNLKKLLAANRPPLIITNRHAHEGGFFRGTIDEQAAILSEAQSLGADYVDIEYRMGKEIINKFRSANKPFVLSYHDFEQTPPDIVEIYHSMKKFRPEIIKIAVTARDITDNATIFRLLKQAKADRQKTIAHCMGERGEISRIISGMFGGYLSFAAENPDRCTGPGQLSFDMMTHLFRSHQINPRTKVFGILGNPVQQSRGIYYHNEIFQRRKKNAVYLRFLIDDIRSFFGSFGSLLSGGSVTMPFKESIIPLLDSIDQSADDISSVNTILRSRGRWYGTNTDLPASMKLLKIGSSTKKKRALILGTGAMARTMIVAVLRGHGIPIIMGRSPSKAKQLADRYRCEWITAGDLSSLDVGFIINATSVGMLNDSHDAILPVSVFRRGRTVFDVVNRSELTPFLTAAKKRGCTIISGKELFQEQAKLQSRLFLRSLA